jgi:hypothetical protein
MLLLRAFENVLAASGMPLGSGIMLSFGVLVATPEGGSGVEGNREGGIPRAWLGVGRESDAGGQGFGFEGR